MQPIQADTASYTTVDRAETPRAPNASPKCSPVIDFIDRHALFVQFIPFLLVVLVFLLSALNPHVGAAIRFAEFPDLR